MRKRITEAHLLLVVTFGLYIGFQFFSQRLLPPMPRAWYMVAGQMVLVLPGLCWMWYRKADFKTFGFVAVSGDNLKMALCVLACAYPVVIILNMLSMLFVENAMSSVIPSVLQYGLFPSLFIMALMPAFNEEFLCRGILYHAYRSISKVGGIVLSAFIFGLLHLNFNQMPYAFFVGIVFALMVEATGSVYTSMVMHFCLNGFNVVLNFMAGNQSGDTSAAASSNAMIQEIIASPQMLKRTLLMVVVLIIIFGGLTAAAIARTFQMNGRNLRAECTEEISMIDIWILTFIGFALFLSYFNTVFL